MMNGLAVLALLLMIVPLQVLIHHMVSDEETIQLLSKMAQDSKVAVLGLYDDVLHYLSQPENFKELFVIPYRGRKHRDPAHKNTPTLVKQITPADQDTSPAHEVEQYNVRNVYFAKSSIPRTHRPPSVQYKVGHVVDHVTDGYRGVVIGWDQHCKAPGQWLSDYGYHEQPSLVSSPHYLLLIQSDDGSVTNSYIPQDHLTLVNVQVHTPHLSHYFTSYSALHHRYIPNERLSALYPRDTVL